MKWGWTRKVESSDASGRSDGSPLDQALSPYPGGDEPVYEIDQILAAAHQSALASCDGEVATYIPELAKADPDHFGIAVATTSGQVHCIGNADAPFTIQSVSKVITYCLALNDVGRETVLGYVGVEPSGDAFNAIELDPHTRRPYNAMVNAGAITIAGLLYRVHGDRAFEIILDHMSRAAGRSLDLDAEVYRSETETGHRNRAIAHLLFGAGAIDGPVDAILDLYFRQCSIRVTARDLACIGATMANLGANPVTDDVIFDVRAVRDMMATMFTCGMYDYSGNWANDVGVPAKSGVSGGILGVVNRKLGIATYAPRLDRKGNSVRGLTAFRMLSEDLGLHAFDLTNPGSAIVDTYFKPVGV